ncbi:PP2C family protein-serine/threonine phosphatase [Planomonospora corallina]|uniref:PP2C family protein-serine/threonine phosphatase n=1 Tax=Planomonospora corallina TaxID=1806052 RepID=A0ABV8IIR0_9ACTN
MGGRPDRHETDEVLQQALARLTLLSDVTSALSSTLATEEAVRRLCRILVPQLADWCVVDLLDDHGQPHRVAAAHRDPERSGGCFAGPPLVCQDAPGPLGQILRGGGPLLLSPAPSGEEPDDPSHAAQEGLLRRLAADSAIIAPLRVRRQVLGALTVVRTDPARPLTVEDQAVVEDLAHRVALAVDNGRLYRAAQHIAERLQRSLLPDRLPEVGALRLAARYSPAHETAEVGGDWYDAFVMPKGDIALIIGDVTGHDLPAAVVMSQLRNMLRTLACDRQEPPGEILRRLDTVNEILYGTRTATCLYGLITGGESGPWGFHHSSAGHPPPLLVTAGGETRYLEGGAGLLLGVDPGVSRTGAYEELPTGSTLLLYTDGLVERPDEHLTHGMIRLRQHAAALARESVEDFCDGVLAGLGESDDDIALIALRVPAAQGLL